VDVSKNIEVQDLILKNRELIRQGKRDKINGWIEMFQFASAESSRRIQRWTESTYGVMTSINNPDDYDLPAIQKILNGQPFDDVDYAVLAPILVLYSNPQIAAVCEDLVLFDMVSIKVTQLYPFQAEWRMVLPT
jgi:hypothetical protein